MAERHEVSRRRFLTYLTAAIGAFIGTVLGLPAVAYVVSPALKGRETHWVPIGSPDTFRVGQPKLVEFTLTRRDGWVEQEAKKSVWVVRKDSQEFAVYNTHCTHLGCIVNWHPDTRTFVSPCHNGIFTIDGVVVGGPPPRPLDTLETKMDGGQLLVDYMDFRLGVPQKEEA